MSASSAARAFATVVARDLRRQLLTAGQLTLFALMVVIVVLVVVAPKIVGASGTATPTIHAIASADVVAVVSRAEPSWDLSTSGTVPTALGADVAVIVDGSTVEVRVERASQVAGAAVVGERFAAAVLAESAGVAPPTISHNFSIDDGDAVLRRMITLVSALLTFSIITGRATWTYGALSRDLSLGLFDAVLARSSPLGMLGGRVVAAVAAGGIQILALALAAALTLVAVGEREVAVRVSELAIPLALWAGAGIALLATLSIVLVLLLRGGGTASVGIAMQLVGFAGFGTLMVALLDPTAAWITVVSLIPPVSVLLLPLRLSEGMAGESDAAVAAAAVGLAIALLFWLSLRAWRAATMTDGTAATWRAVVRPGRTPQWREPVAVVQTAHTRS